MSGTGGKQPMVWQRSGHISRDDYPITPNQEAQRLSVRADERLKNIKAGSKLAWPTSDAIRYTLRGSLVSQ
jgi:hypothetical protein